jgi:hypothetical protein
MTVPEIIGLLGGSSAVARFTGWPVTTVDSWQHGKHIPDWRRAKLLEMAASLGKRLATTDFPEKERKAA